LDLVIAKEVSIEFIKDYVVSVHENTTEEMLKLVEKYVKSYHHKKSLQEILEGFDLNIPWLAISNSS
jgi:hypothetical protein